MTNETVPSTYDSIDIEGEFKSEMPWIFDLSGTHNRPSDLLSFLENLERRIFAIEQTIRRVSR